MTPQRRAHTLIAAALFAAGVIAAASLVPLPSPEDGERVSLRLDFTASRTILGKYDISMKDWQARPMTLIVWSYLTTHFCFACTTPHEVSVVLKTPDGRVVAKESRDIGEFRLITNDAKSVSVVFLNVPLGSYVAEARLLDEHSDERAEFSESIYLTTGR